MHLSSLLAGVSGVLSSAGSAVEEGADGGSGAPDLAALGLLFAIVGSFLLANSILFRAPRSMVAQFFGREERRLTTIRATMFHRLQVHLGFLILLVGFGLQLIARLRPQPEVAPELPLHWVGGLLVGFVALELGGWWLSRVWFRQTVRAWFRDHPPHLESDLPLARELGELFGVPPQGDDSVPSYLMRVRHRVGIRPHAGPPSGFERGLPSQHLEDEEDAGPAAETAEAPVSARPWILPAPGHAREDRRGFPSGR